MLHCLTKDVDRFCVAVVDLYSNLLKPFLDIVLYVRYLGKNLGFHGPSILLGYLAVIGLLLTNLRRPISRMTAREQALEGEFRFVNSRIIASAEEVAFYDGAKREKETIMGVFSKLMAHLRHILHFRYAFVMHL